MYKRQGDSVYRNSALQYTIWSGVNAAEMGANACLEERRDITSLLAMKPALAFWE